MSYFRFASLAVLFAIALFSLGNNFAQSPTEPKINEVPQQQMGPGDLIEIDFDKHDPGKSEIAVGKLGSLVKIFAQRPSPKGFTARKTLRVEVVGDAVERFRTFMGPILFWESPGNWNSKPDRTQYACFLRADRAGAATVKVSVVEPNGRSGEAKEWKIVVLRNQQIKDTSTQTETPAIPMATLNVNFRLKITQNRPTFTFSPDIPFGSMLELRLNCPADKTDKPYIETMKISEIKGDSVRFINSVVSTYGKKEEARRQICCYVISEKVGTTSFVLTGIGADGNPVPNAIPCTIEVEGRQGESERNE